MDLYWNIVRLVATAIIWSCWAVLCDIRDYYRRHQ